MARIPASTDPAAINLIGEGSELEGVMRSASDVRVNGRINGELHVVGKVIVAEKGLIDGTLKAAFADVAGTVLGDLHIQERLVLKATAKVEGTIRAARLVMEEGAHFDGQCDMGRLEPKRKEMLAGQNGDVAKASFALETGAAKRG
jgi:cytoskeletal protein CcmA (bactofilin family)